MKPILLVLAIVLLVFQSFSFNPFPPIELGWFGLAFFAGFFLVKE